MAQLDTCSLYPDGSATEFVTFFCYSEFFQEMLYCFLLLGVIYSKFISLQAICQKKKKKKESEK